MRVSKDLFARAAELLLDGPGAAPPDAVTLRLLAALRWQDAAALDRAERLSRGRLLAAAAAFDAFFALTAPDAPSLFGFGAKISAAGVCGVGLTPGAAFAGCVGEGVEFLSQLAHGDEDVSWASLDAQAARPGDHRAGTFAFRLGASAAPMGTSIAWLQGRDLILGRPASVPATLCLRNEVLRSAPPATPLSLGCAAGSSPAAAMLHGLLEVVERDAACLWWRGGVPPCGLADNDPALRAGAEALAILRGGRTGRRSWLLDISSDIALPCIAAISCGESGLGVACGLAARCSRAAAARAAVLELCQMELAVRLSQQKRHELGQASLGPVDLSHLRRYGELDGQRCALLQPAEASAVRHDYAEVDAERSLTHAVACLRERGIDCYAVDLTRPSFGIPVFQVICPALEAEPSALRGERLLAAEAMAGGGLPHTAGVPLF